MRAVVFPEMLERLDQHGRSLPRLGLKRTKARASESPGGLVDIRLVDQQDTQLSLLTAPRLTSSSSASGNG